MNLEIKEGALSANRTATPLIFWKKIDTISIECQVNAGRNEGKSAGSVCGVRLLFNLSSVSASAFPIAFKTIPLITKSRCGLYTYNFLKFFTRNAITCQESNKNKT
jgi:hypothetical protein